MNKTEKRQGISLFGFVAVASNVLMCATVIDRASITAQERTALAVVYYLAFVAVVETAVMYLGAKSDSLYRVAAGIFAITFAIMLVLPILFTNVGLTILGGTAIIFVCLGGVLALLGAMFAVIPA